MGQSTNCEKLENQKRSCTEPPQAQSFFLLSAEMVRTALLSMAPIGEANISGDD